MSIAGLDIVAGTHDDGAAAIAMRLRLRPAVGDDMDAAEAGDRGELGVVVNDAARRRLGQNSSTEASAVRAANTQ